MKTKLFTLLCLLTIALNPLVAQDATDINGTWIIESAQVNLLEKGMSEKTHEYSANEMKQGLFFTQIRFSGKGCEVTIADQTKQCSYIYENGMLTFSIESKAIPFSAWLDSGKNLILISENKDAGYKGNELRLSYKRMN